MKIGLGPTGESIALEFLMGKGYKAISRNDRYKEGEIDLVVRSKDGVLVFVEVKTMSDRGESGLRPEDNMTSAKMRKFIRACETYVSRNQDKVDERGWRMDLVAVSLGEKADIRHYENL